MALQWTRVGHLQVEMVCGQLVSGIFQFDTNILDANELCNDAMDIDYEMEEDDWSNEMAQAPVVDLNSKCNVNSLHFIQQHHMEQSSFTSMSKSHLDCGMNLTFRTTLRPRLNYLKMDRYLPPVVAQKPL
jgi:hypothetical protein